MNRNQLNFFVDFLAGISFILSMASGLIRDWHKWHTPVSLLLCLLVIIHLVLHYKWVFCTIRSLFKANPTPETCSKE